MLLQVLKHFIYLFADDVLEVEGNFHQPFHMILMIMGNGRVTFQAEAAMPSAQNLILLSQVRTPHHDNLYITIYKPFWRASNNRNQMEARRRKVPVRSCRRGETSYGGSSHQRSSKVRDEQL